MAAKKTASSAQPVGQGLSDDPFEGEQLLLEAIFGDEELDDTARNTARSATRPAKRLVEVAAPIQVASALPLDLDETPLKPEHYKVVSISLYKEDIERLDAYVRELKRRGHYKANKSQVIRQALLQLDLDRISNER
jgi:hypothetical protein